MQKLFTGKVGQMKTDNKWLASEDFMGLGEVRLKIEAVYENQGETMQDGKKKDFYSVAFQKTDKQLVLNATNRKALAHAFGADTKKWIGQDIFLFAQDGIRAIGGGTTMGLRLRAAGSAREIEPTQNPFKISDSPPDGVQGEPETGDQGGSSSPSSGVPCETKAGESVNFNEEGER